MIEGDRYFVVVDGLFRCIVVRDITILMILLIPPALIPVFGFVPRVTGPMILSARCSSSPAASKMTSRSVVKPPIRSRNSRTRDHYAKRTVWKCFVSKRNF